MDVTPTCPLFQLTSSVMLMRDHTAVDFGPFTDGFRMTTKLESSEKAKSSNIWDATRRRIPHDISLRTHPSENLKTLQGDELRKY
jgi:hypothetical protein